MWVSMSDEAVGVTFQEYTTILLGVRLAMPVAMTFAKVILPDTLFG